MYRQDLLKWYFLSEWVFFVDSVDYASENSNNSQKEQCQSWFIGHLFMRAKSNKTDANIAH